MGADWYSEPNKTCREEAQQNIIIRSIVQTKNNPNPADDSKGTTALRL